MELNFKEFGQGDPVIILHGLFGTLDNWQTIAKRMAENYTVYIVDQRNHGRSPHAEPFDYPTMAADLKEFMEANWIFNAHIIGHSMGGKTVMQFALENPDMVNKLVVADIAPVQYEPRHNHIFQALFDLDLANLNSRGEADNSLKNKITDWGERQFLLKNLTRKKEGGYRFKMNLPVIYKHYRDILAAIENLDNFDGSTLFIKGGLSQHIQEVHYEAIDSLFPNAAIKIIDNAGHWVHADAPDEFLNIVLDFLSE
jgi:pimeloyl-ACP methyl ester carboxylesterase